MSIPRIGGGKSPFRPPAPEIRESPVNPNSTSVQVADARQGSPDRLAAVRLAAKLKQGGSQSFSTQSLKEAITVVEKSSGSGVAFFTDNDKRLYVEEFEDGKSAFDKALSPPGDLEKLRNIDVNRWKGVPDETVRKHYEGLKKAVQFLYDNRHDIASINKGQISWEGIYTLQQAGLLRTPPLPPLLHRGNKYEFAEPRFSIGGRTELVYRYKNEAMKRDDIIVIIEGTGEAWEGKQKLIPAPGPVKDRAR